MDPQATSTADTQKASESQEELELAAVEEASNAPFNGDHGGEGSVPAPREESGRGRKDYVTVPANKKRQETTAAATTATKDDREAAEATD